MSLFNIFTLIIVGAILYRRGKAWHQNRMLDKALAQPGNKEELKKLEKSLKPAVMPQSETHHWVSQKLPLPLFEEAQAIARRLAPGAFLYRFEKDDDGASLAPDPKMMLFFSSPDRLTNSTVTIKYSLRDHTYETISTSNHLTAVPKELKDIKPLSETKLGAEEAEQVAETHARKKGMARGSYRSVIKAGEGAFDHVWIIDDFWKGHVYCTYFINATTGAVDSFKDVR